MAIEAAQVLSSDRTSLSDVLAVAKRIAEGVIRENATQIDKDCSWPEAGLRALQAAGLGGLVVDRKFGGLGHGLMALAKVCEILGRECASTAICFGMHCVGSSVIAARATDHHTRAFLRPICEGKHLTTLALSEAGTGSHFYFPQTRLTHVDEATLRIDGQKHFVTNGAHVDSYVVSVMNHDPEGLVQFSCTVLPDGTEGMTWHDSWQGFGMRGNDSRTLDLVGVHLDARNLLGSEGDQIWYMFNVVAPYFLAAMSGTYLGVASDALEIARAHLTAREFKHDGRRLADSSVLQQRLGTLWAKTEAVRQLLYNGARMFDAGDENAVIHILSSKAEVADVATHVVNEAMTMMGGTAYRDGDRMQRHLRDVRAAHVMAPTTDLLRIWTGRKLLGLALFGDE